MIHLSVVNFDKLKLFFPGAVNSMKEAGLQLGCSPKGLSLTDNIGNPVGTRLMIKPSVIDGLLMAADSTFQRSAVVGMLKSWLTENLLFVEAGAAQPTAPVTPEPKPMKPVWSIDKMAVGTWGDVCENPGDLPVVKLTGATKLYQRVHGTSGGSVYFYIAGCPELKMAARYKNMSLSIRVEGGVSTYCVALDQAGFKVTADYASIHLSAPSNQMLARAVGALMYSIGVQWKTPMPQLATLIEHSNTMAK